MDTKYITSRLNKESNLYKGLVDRIYQFISQYAKQSPNSEEGEIEYTSPDAYELLSCAELLSKEIIPKKCWSEWGSGGYSPYNSKEGKQEHDSIMSEINSIIKNG